MSTPEFYEVLGIEPHASADQIKKAYRTLSLKYHPDRTQGDEKSSEIYKKINEAYETLGDQDKRKEYDTQQKFSGGIGDFASFFGGQPPMPPGFMQGEMPGFSDPNELFSALFSGNMGGNFVPPPGTQMKFQVFQNGVPVEVNFDPNVLHKPTAITSHLKIGMDIVLTGGKVPFEIERWVLQNGQKVFEKQKVYVDITQGMDDGEVLLLENHGHVLNENCKGDVKLIVKVENDTEYVRRGLDLFVEKSISLKDALCGFSFELKYLNGKTYSIANKASSMVITPGYQKTIPNMGISRGGTTGSLIIAFIVKFPEAGELDEPSLEKLREVLP
tara:strand:- start:6459 stop:7448 length:990 start_codon:yes stop_codon:yes gene_type:complete